MVELIVQFYEVNYENASREKIRQRQNEITHCFKKNIANPHVSKVHFLYEKKSDVDFMIKEGIEKENPKIVYYDLGTRINYSAVFKYANTYCKNKICLYLHADMCINSGFDNIENMENKVYALTAHHLHCNRKFICNCTRQFKTSKGIYGPTFDGFVFQSPIKEKVVKDGDHYVGMMGSENRIICILKENDYEVVCPNNILFCYHHHNVKIFSNKRGRWVNRGGEIKELEYYSNIHKSQINLPWEEKIVGGGIPFFMGTCKFISEI